MYSSCVKEAPFLAATNIIVLLGRYNMLHTKPDPGLHNAVDRQRDVMVMT